MTSKRSCLASALAFLALAFTALPGHAAPAPARLLKTIALPHAGRFADYLAISPDHKTVWVGYTSDNSLIAIDTASEKVVKTIAGLPRVHTIAIPWGSPVGYASDGGENKVAVIDLASGKVLQRIPVGAGPDGIIADQAAGLIYVGNHKGKSGSLIDPITHRVVATIPLGGTPEFMRADPNTGLIYQNLESSSELVVIDPRKRAVIARFKLAPGKAPSGLALDAGHHLLFSACDNNMVVILDQRTGKQLGTLPIGAGVDFADYDPVLRRVYTANGESATMTVIQLQPNGKAQVLANVPTFAHGHALVVDPDSHRVYVVHGDQVSVYATI